PSTLQAPSIQTPAAALATPSPGQRGAPANSSGTGEPMLLPPLNPGSGSGGGSGSGTGGGSGTGSETGSATGSGSAGSGQPASGGGGKGNGGAGGQRGSVGARGDGRPGIGPALPEPPGGKPQAPRPLRPARLSGDGESIVFVECKADVVVVYPTRRVV